MILLGVLAPQLGMTSDGFYGPLFRRCMNQWAGLLGETATPMATDNA
jgi:hypothetical protein